MDFILNSKTKKVEIFYENAAEQQAILEFMSRYLTYKEDKTTPNIYIHDSGISWTNAASTNPYTISISDNLPETISLDNCSHSTINAVKLESNISDSITAAINPKEKKAYAVAKLDSNSDEGGYSCLTAHVPCPLKKVEAVDFGEPMTIK